MLLYLGFRSGSGALRLGASEIEEVDRRFPTLDLVIYLVKEMSTGRLLVYLSRFSYTSRTYYLYNLPNIPPTIKRNIIESYSNRPRAS